MRSGGLASSAREPCPAWTSKFTREGEELLLPLPLLYCRGLCRGDGAADWLPLSLKSDARLLHGITQSERGASYKPRSDPSCALQAARKLAWLAGKTSLHCPEPTTESPEPTTESCTCLLLRPPPSDGPGLEAPERLYPLASEASAARILAVSTQLHIVISSAVLQLQQREQKHVLR